LVMAEIIKRILSISIPLNMGLVIER